jgi:4-hydroxybenzoate polyprenyltransferase
MRKAMEYAIRSHLHLAIFSFVYVLGLYKGNLYTPYYALMFAFGILSIYNFHRLWKLKRGDLPDIILKWLVANKVSIASLSIISLFLTIYLYLSYFAQNYLIHLLCAVCLLISILYVYRLRRYSLREIPYIKIFLVLGIWYFLLHIMPCMLFNSVVYPVEGLLLLFAILIPSDMKDIDYDPKEMKTIPQLIGTNNSLKLMRVLSVIGICYLIIAQKEHALPWFLSFSYLFALTFLHSKINKDYYFVWIDASFLIVGVGLYCY